jgi:hypothetical protein
VGAQAAAARTKSKRDVRIEVLPFKTG